MNPSAIVLLFLLVLLLLAAERRSRRLLRRLGRPADSGRRLLRDGCLLAALLLLLTSGAPPPRPSEPAELTLALAVDVSTSMRATDEFPSRLEKARSEIALLIEALPQARFALIPFAGEAVVQVPPTRDLEAMRFFVRRFSHASLAQPGSDPAAAVRLAQQSLQGLPGERAVILFSDGERTVAAPPTPPHPEIPVYAFPLGTTQGSPVLDPAGRPRHTSSGAPLTTRLEREALRKLAAATGGELLSANLGAARSLRRCWSPAGMEAADSGRRLPLSGHLAASLTAMFLLLLPYLLRPRPWPAAITAGLLLLLGALVACNDGRSAQDGRALFRRALENYRSDRPEQARLDFAAAAARMEGGERGRALFNLGTLLLEAGEADRAVETLGEAQRRLPGDDQVRRNLALALRLAAAGQEGGAASSTEQPGEKEPSRQQSGRLSAEQARRLLRSVRPGTGPEAPQGARAVQLQAGRDW